MLAGVDKSFERKRFGAAKRFVELCVRPVDDLVDPEVGHR